jgi:hemoglobin
MKSAAVGRRSLHPAKSERGCSSLLRCRARRLNVAFEMQHLREAAKVTVYDLLGGAAAMDAAVDAFYRRVLSDDRIAGFFDDVDMERQAAKQKAFLTMVLGGPAAYAGKDMRTAHAHLVQRGLSDAHFDAVVENLGATLAELGVPAELVARVAATAESVRADVLGR